MSCSRVVTMAKVIWKCTHAERRFGREWPLFCVDAVKSHQRCYVYIQLSPLLSGMVRESLKSSLRRSCCGEVRCEKEKNFCVDNFSELAQLLDFCSTRTSLHTISVKKTPVPNFYLNIYIHYKPPLPPQDGPATTHHHHGRHRSELRQLLQHYWIQRNFYFAPAHPTKLTCLPLRNGPMKQWS